MKNDYNDREFWGEAQVRARPAKKGSLFFRVLLLIFIGLATFAAFGLAGYRMAAYWLGAPAALGGTGSEPGEEPRALPRSVLLIGVDARRENEPSRSDTIMLAFLDEAGRRLDILSVPRDSYVRIPGYGSDKINAAHALGGAELLLETVNTLLGTRVTKYVEVDFQGFEKIVDALGGVEIEVDKRMYYPPEGIDLQAGLQHLNGRDALGYVRFRNDPEGDITRIGRQQKFLKAMLDQAFKLSTIPKIPRLVGDLNRYVQTNLSTAEMIGLALFLKDLDSTMVVTHTVPGEGRYINGISYWVIDEEKLEEVLNSIPGLKGR